MIKTTTTMRIRLKNVSTLGLIEEEKKTREVFMHWDINVVVFIC